MKKEPPAAVEEVESLLNRLRDAYQQFIDTVAAIPPDGYQTESAEGESPRRILERSADDVNLYYGRLIARAVSLPQPPGLGPAEFGSLEEARASLQQAHKSLSNLLHDLTAEDLDRKTRLETTAEYTLRQVLETAVAHYRLRTQQLSAILEGQQKGASHDPRHRR